MPFPRDEAYTPLRDRKDSMRASRVISLATLFQRYEAETLLKKVGETPVIQLNGGLSSNVRMYAKLEWHNPFGSVKDRAAYWMIRSGERRGVLRKGRHIIIEPTSGNTGIALAGIARLLGYQVEAIVPEAISEETKQILRASGATVSETQDDLCPRVGKGTDQAIALAEALVKSHPGKYFMPNQYDNEANFLAHYEGTAPEIWRQTEGRITHFVAGIGTGGTITGVAKFLKERNPSVKVIAVEPQQGHHLQGLRNLQDSSMPQLLGRRADLVDEWVRVSDAEAFAEVKRIAETENLFVGPSSGAVSHVVHRLAENLGSGVVLGVFADDGCKYRSVYTKFKVFTDEEFTVAEERARLPGLRLLRPFIKGNAERP